MEAIIQLAERLGKAIGESPQAARLRKARQALRDETETAKLLQDYNAQAAKIAQLEDENSPIEVADKHRLQELRNRLTGSPTFKAFSAAQVEYVDLMRRVNEAISSNLQDVEET